MRLPCDAALIIMDAQAAIDDPRWASRNNPGAESVVSDLLAAWRAEGLPVFHVRDEAMEPGLPRPTDAARQSVKKAPPPARETTIAKSTRSAFVGTGLEEALDEIGATTLVVCGGLTNDSLEATVRHGGDLGYRIFVVADACWTIDKRDPSGRLWQAADVHALSLANMHGESAEAVDSRTALRAAAAANARRRRR